MPLLVTSAAGNNGNGFGKVLAFDSGGSPLGIFTEDSRLADPRGMTVNSDEGLLFLNSGHESHLGHRSGRQGYS
jgi:hypothetical protein